MPDAKSILRAPIHGQVAALVRQEIARLRAGDKLESEVKLAQRLGVSVHTVREAITTFAHQGLVERRAGKGTTVCERKSPQHIALWLAVDPLHAAACGLRLLSRLHAELVNGGFRVKIYMAHAGLENQAGDAAYKELLEDLRERRVRGFVFASGGVGSEARQLMEQTGVAVVSNEPAPSGGGYWVADDVAGALQAGVQHLADHGCRRIAFMNWSDPRAADPSPDVFRRSLNECGVPVREEWIRGDLHPSLAGAGYAELREIWSSRSEKPDGLVVGDDVLVEDVVTAILELGLRVPEQLRVVAHANKGMVTCRYFPAARIEFDTDERAQAMAKLMTKLARGEPVAMPQVVLPYRWREPSRAPAVVAGGQLVNR